MFARVLVTAALLVGAGVGVSHAERKWLPLTDDASRGQIFAAHVDTSNGAIGTRRLPERFKFPRDSKFDGDTERKDSVFGIDISHHNEDECHCTIDWSAMRGQNVAFVVLKASEGVGYDRTFAHNWKAIGDLPPDRKLYRGAYHFLRADEDAAEQAQAFLHTIGTLGPGDMAPTLDIEWDPHGCRGCDHWADLDGDEIKAMALTWLKAVEKATGKRPMIYTNRSWWRERVGDKNIKAFEGYPIWIAHYAAKARESEKPPLLTSKANALWQFTEKALLPFNGADRVVDVNIYKGPVQGLEAALGVGH